MKQPDETEATASFSFDDTPLARELADLSARRRALENAEVCAELFRVPMPALRPKHQQYERLADWFAAHGRGLSHLGLV